MTGTVVVVRGDRTIKVSKGQAAEIAEPEDALVLGDLAEEFGLAGT